MPNLTNEQIRDRLTRIAGIPPCEPNPIPPLDSPEALGVVAGLRRGGWSLRLVFGDDSCAAKTWRSGDSEMAPITYYGDGFKDLGRCTALAVIAAHEAEGGKHGG